jgi:hypothetical protein
VPGAASTRCIYSIVADGDPKVPAPPFLLLRAGYDPRMAETIEDVQEEPLAEDGDALDEPPLAESDADDTIGCSVEGGLVRL